MSATGIVKIGGEHHLWESNLIAAFEKALGIKVQKAQAAMIATLSNQLIVDKRGMITRTPANTKALLSVGPIFQKLLSAQGYGPLITAFVGQFPAGFEFFESTMKALNLPKIDWAAKDKAALQAQQLTSLEALKSVVATVAENAKKQALFSIGGLKLQELAELLRLQTGKTLPQAVGLAETAMSMHYATLADIGYAKYEASGIPVRFKYYGPQDSIARPFCSKLLGSAKAYTRAEIAAMDNGQIPNVMVSRGGYRCRHQWILAIDALDMSPPPDPTTKEDPAPAKREPKRVAAGGDKRTGPQVREQIKAKAAELAGAKPRERAEAIRELLYAERPATIKIDMKPGKGSREDFRSARWNEGLDEFRRLLGSGTADGLTAKFVKTRKQRVFYSPDLKAVSIQADTPVATIMLD